MQRYYCFLQSLWGMNIHNSLDHSWFWLYSSVFKLFMFSVQRKHISLSSCIKWFSLNTLLYSSVYTSSIIQQSLIRDEVLLFL